MSEQQRLIRMAVAATVITLLVIGTIVILRGSPS